MKLLMFRDGGTPRLGVGRDGAPDEIVDVRRGQRLGSVRSRDHPRRHRRRRGGARSSARPGVVSAGERGPHACGPDPAAAVRPAARERARDRSQLPEARRGDRTRLERRGRAADHLHEGDHHHRRAVRRHPHRPVGEHQDRLGGRAGRGHRTSRRQHQAPGRARPCLRLHGAQRRHRTRHPERLGRSVVQGEEPRRILPGAARGC